MNVDVYLNGNNISQYTVKYTRESKICSGIGTLELSLSQNFTGEIFTWDTITIYEEDELAGTYSVSEVSYDEPEYLINIAAQDDSKRLQDYFIAERYEIKYISTNLYWIEKFLAEAGITYVVETGTTAVYLQADTSIGPIGAYEEIIQLLQMGGLYIHFTEDNTCRIGKLSKDLSIPDYRFDEEDVLSIKTTKDDRMLRNRAVVWGKGDPSAKNWIFADVSRDTTWNYDSNDKRAGVLANSSIPSFGSAYAMATKMLDEFARITFTKTITVHGARGVTIGDIVFIDTPVFCGSGLVTTAGTSMSSSGLITNITLDERCPRLFDYFGLKDYVYVGMNGDGVWRKKLDEWEWENYSTGLTDLVVTDLYKNNGILSCVTENGYLFRRNEYSSSWTQVPLSGLSITVSGEDTQITEGLKARAVTQDRFTNIIHAIVDNREENNRREYGVSSSGLMSEIYNSDEEYCWVVDVSPYNGTIIDVSQVTLSGASISGITFSGSTISGVDHILGFDIDNDGKNDYISVAAIESGTAPSDIDIGWDGEQYSFGSKMHTRNGSSPMYTSLMDSKNYNDSGQSLDSGLLGSVYAESIFLIDDKDDRGLAYLTESRQLYWIPINTTDGSLSWGSSKHHTATLSFGDGASYYVRILAIRRDPSDKNIFNIYYYYTDPTYDELWKCTVNFTTSSHTNTLIVHPFVKPYFDYPTGSTPYWAAEREIMRDKDWYIVKTEVISTLTHYKVYYVDFVTETQTCIFDYTLSASNITPGNIFYWGTSKTCKFTPMLCSTINGGWDINFGYLGAGGDLHLVTRTIDKIVCYQPYSAAYLAAHGVSFSDIVFKSQGDITQVSFDYFGRKMWVEYSIPVISKYVTDEVAITYEGYSTRGTPILDGGPDDTYYTDEKYEFQNGASSENISQIYGQTYGLNGLATTWHWVNAITGTSTGDVTAPSGYTLHGVYCTLDSVHNYAYIQAVRDSDSVKVILALDSSNTIKREILYNWYENASYPNAVLKSFGNFLIWMRNYSTDKYGHDYTYAHTSDIGSCQVRIHYLNNDTGVDLPESTGGGSIIFLVARKEEDYYEVVQSGIILPYRIDLSLDNPMVVVTSGELGAGFIETLPGNAHYMSDNADLALINDFRYTTINDTTSGLIKQFYYSREENLLSLNITDLTVIDWDAYVIESVTASGIVGKIETSNHQLPYQYLFVSTEPAPEEPGYSRFFQTDPMSGLSFIEFTEGLPSGLINIIRIDDRI